MAVVALISKYIELDYLWYNLFVEHFFDQQEFFYIYLNNKNNEIKVVYWAYWRHIQDRI